MIDQFLLYDQSITTWVTSTFPPLLPGRVTQILVATPKRVFAEVTTGRIVDNNTLALPRITVTKLDTSNDPKRFNSNGIRRLGWDDQNYQRSLKSGRFPAPVNITYQLDFWTRHVKEMNLWEQKVLWDFAPQYIYLKIRPDDVWQDKSYILFLDGSLTNNSDLDPAGEDRIIRKTATLRAEARLYDQSLSVVYIVKRFEFQWLDYDTGNLFDRTFLPPFEVIGVGTGAQMVFGPITLTRKPVLKHAVLVQTMISGTGELAQDNGLGVITGPRTSGTIVYATGVINLTFTAPPDTGIDITASYFTDLA